MYDFLKNFKPQVKNENLAIFGYFFSKMAEISRGRPLQGTDFILTLLDAELTTSTKEMNPKWKIEVFGRF